MFVQSTDSLQIHYQLEGSADLPVLVLVHGFYGSLQDWYEYGYVESLQKEYHLVLIEVRGHGMSGKPTNPAAYSHDQRARDVLTVLDEVHCKQAFYYGFSMGGWISYKLMELAPERFTAFGIGASHPYAQPISQWKEDILTLEKWVGRLEISPYHKQRFMQNDRTALIGACAEDRVDTSAAVLANPTPHLFIYGSKDPVAHKLDPLKQIGENNQFVEMDGVDHMGCLTRSDLILPELTRFFNKSPR
jgi:pimeloyl-ACP methyl ester carboxylesterase